MDMDYSQYLPFYEAVKRGDLFATRRFLSENPLARTAPIAIEEKTALHVAALFGHLDIVQELVQGGGMMSNENIARICAHRLTALHEAVYAGMDEIARFLVERNRDLLNIQIDGLIPLNQALSIGHKQLARSLYPVTKVHPWNILQPGNGNQGASLLNLCYRSNMLDIALELLKEWPGLALEHDYRGSTFFEALASIPSSFPSGYVCNLPFWQRWIYNWVDVQQELASGSIYKMIFTSLGIKKIYEAKSVHMLAKELLSLACERITAMNEKDLKAIQVHTSLNRAAQTGIPEFIMQVLKVHIHLLWKCGGPTNVFFSAVEYRQPQVFSLIHGIPFKHALANERDNVTNGILLHLAAKLAPSTQLHNISGAALQMQRELQWFQEVESITPPTRKDHVNNNDKTPRAMFTEEHKDLIKQGENWMKETAGSSTVVAALVATIVFAAAFTVPGGNDQNTGYPIFSKETLFMLFIISDAVSLFSSATAALMFLGILTSRYAENDFLKSLPTKLIIGLSTLFISIATMMVAFCATLFLMLHEQVWIIIPVILLACVPVTWFVWLQFPLLIEIYVSTYGPSTFNRNVQRWL